MDECDTAAKTMECGRIEAPDIFDDILTVVDHTQVVCYFVI